METLIICVVQQVGKSHQGKEIYKLRLALQRKPEIERNWLDLWQVDFFLAWNMSNKDARQMKTDFENIEELTCNMCSSSSLSSIFMKFWSSGMEKTSHWLKIKHKHTGKNYWLSWTIFMESRPHPLSLPSIELTGN